MIVGNVNQRKDGKIIMNNKFDATTIMNNIIETWHLEAKQENENLFYYINEVNAIKSGKKSYIIGRKGMGKTAISEYLYSQKSSKIFTERLSFKNFPFNRACEKISVN